MQTSGRLVPRAHFENTGTLKKTLRDGHHRIATSLDNDGSVEVGSGTLALTGGRDPGASDSSSGDLAAASGTTLRFSEFTSGCLVRDLASLARAP